MKRIFYMCAVAIFMLTMGMVSSSYAAHPLITDDAGTLDKGKFEIELNGEYGNDEEKEEGITVEEKEFEIAVEATYGITGNLDVKLGVPYVWIDSEVGDEDENNNGVGDISLALKYRFLNKEHFALSIKPEITLPTGDDDKELGAGRVTYSLYLIGTTETGPVELSMNLGYLRNDNTIDEEKDIWHASLAGVYGVIEHLDLVGNIGIESNRDKGSNTDPVFLIGGIIYEINHHVRVDAGVKFGLNEPEVDYALLAGIAFEF